MPFNSRFIYKMKICKPLSFLFVGCEDLFVDLAILHVGYGFAVFFVFILFGLL